jgi:hypothetical protein
MKHTLLLALFLLFIGCSSDSNPEDGLPKETQTGANTFGCLIDGKLYKPRCEEPSVAFPQWGMIVWGSYDSTPNANEIEVRDIKSDNYFNLLIHIHEIKLTGIGNYQIDESNGFSDIDGLYHNYVNCIIYDNVTNQYKKYVSYENSGSVIITRYTEGSSNPLSGAIISGTFSGKLRNIYDPNDELEINKGRFDVNGLTSIYKEFP